LRHWLRRRVWRELNRGPSPLLLGAQAQGGRIAWSC